MLNPVLSLDNFREHSLFGEFLEEIESDLNTHDPTEYEIYEAFLTWLEDL